MLEVTQSSMDKSLRLGSRQISKHFSSTRKALSSYTIRRRIFEVKFYVRPTLTRMQELPVFLEILFSTQSSLSYPTYSLLARHLRLGNRKLFGRYMTYNLHCLDNQYCLEPTIEALYWQHSFLGAYKPDRSSVTPVRKQTDGNKKRKLLFIKLQN